MCCRTEKDASTEDSEDLLGPFKVASILERPKLTVCFVIASCAKKYVYDSNMIVIDAEFVHKVEIYCLRMPQNTVLMIISSILAYLLATAGALR